MLPTELVETLVDSGVFSLFTPREVGGEETSLTTALRIYEELARIDGSTGWRAWHANFGWTAAFLNDSAVDRIWADGATQPVLAGSRRRGRAVRVDGGYLVSGHWERVSGLNSAEWFLCPAWMCDGTPGGGREIRLCHVDVDLITIADPSRSPGLRGSDSASASLVDVFVPADLALDITGRARIDRPLYRIPGLSLVFPGRTAVLLGIARAAIDEIVASVAHRADATTAIRRAGSTLRAARLSLLSAADELDALAAAGQSISRRHRAALRRSTSRAAEVGRQVLRSTYGLCGSSSAGLGSRMERILRDGMTVGRVGPDPVR
jgi:alkylation response protein AidB-like acyl-CoA dehydrogenase